MPQVSRYPISQSIYEKIFELLTRILTESHGEEEAKQLMDDLLTPTEKIMLAKRLATSILLLKGYSYGEIMKILRVSKDTVAVASLHLKYGGEGYKRFGEKIIREEKMKNFWDEIQSGLLFVASAGEKKGA